MLIRPPRADAEASRRRAVAGSSAYSSKNPESEIERQSFRHACRPPSPADSLIKNSGPLEIPRASIGSGQF